MTKPAKAPSAQTRELIVDLQSLGVRLADEDIGAPSRRGGAGGVRLPSQPPPSAAISASGSTSIRTPWPPDGHPCHI